MTVIHAMTSPIPGPGMVAERGLPRPDRQHAGRSWPARNRPAPPTPPPSAGSATPASRSRPRKPAPASRTPATAARYRHRCAVLFPISTSTPLRGAGMRQEERQQQHEHQDRDHHRPQPGSISRRHPAFGRLDIGAIFLEAVLRCLICPKRSSGAPADGGGHRGRHSRGPACPGRWCGAAPRPRGRPRRGYGDGSAPRRRRSDGAARRR